MCPRIVVTLMAALLPTGLAPPVARAHLNGDQVTAAEVREIAREAYVYGFPMVDNLRIQHSYCVDKTSPEYKAPYNQLLNIPRVYMPDDKAMQTPNS